MEVLKRTVKKLEQTIEKMNDRLQSVEHMSDEFFKALEDIDYFDMYLFSVRYKFTCFYS